MKQLFVGVAVATVLVACKTSSDASQVKEATDSEPAHNISNVTCRDDSGDRLLTIKRSQNELPFPTYHIEFVFRGEAFTNVSDAPVTRNTQTSFMVQKISTVDDREGIEVSAGVNWTDGVASGFYMEAANGGASPLPGVTFQNCEISEIGGSSSDVNRQNIKKMTCRDTSGERLLVIERSLNELPFPTYHIRFSFRNRLVAEISDAPVVRNSPQSFMVQKTGIVDDQEDTQVSAGANWTDGMVKGFYAEAANGGLSPLPSIQFGTCVVENVTF